jgi:hypothetical protein
MGITETDAPPRTRTSDTATSASGRPVRLRRSTGKMPSVLWTRGASISPHIGQPRPTMCPPMFGLGT